MLWEGLLRRWASLAAFAERALVRVGTEACRPSAPHNCPYYAASRQYQPKQPSGLRGPGGVAAPAWLLAPNNSQLTARIALSLPSCSAGRLVGEPGWGAKRVQAGSDRLQKSVGPSSSAMEALTAVLPVAAPLQVPGMPEVGQAGAGVPAG